MVMVLFALVHNLQLNDVIMCFVACHQFLHTCTSFSGNSNEIMFQLGIIEIKVKKQAMLEDILVDI